MWDVQGLLIYLEGICSFLWCTVGKMWNFKSTIFKMAICLNIPCFIFPGEMFGMIRPNNWVHIAKCISLIVVGVCDLIYVHAQNLPSRKTNLVHTCVVGEHAYSISLRIPQPCKRLNLAAIHQSLWVNYGLDMLKFPTNNKCHVFVCGWEHVCSKINLRFQKILLVVFSQALVTCAIC
jgi:hypothetical protein